MKLGFYGAAHEVTGSCTLIEVGNVKGIVDFGMEQGKDIYVNVPLPVEPSALDFVLLTHAHIDHSGMLPKLWKDGYRGPIYATRATCSLCEVMLRDSASIQESEAEWKNRKAQRSGSGAVEPVYTMEDAESVLKQFRPCSYHQVIQVNDHVSIRMTDVGHLLGSAAIEVWLHEDGVTKKVCFSGDVGNSNQPILRDPQCVAEADYVVIESTYGDRLHSTEQVDYVSELAKRIQKTLDRGGNVIIPSFAVGRTQEILYFLREIQEKGLVTGHGNFPVYMDSPLAIEATGIFLQCDTDFVDEKMQQEIRSGINPLVFPGLQLAVTQEESVAINEDTVPKVIISASGMCDAGRVRHHLKHNLWRPECMVLFVGYQSVGTLGRILVDGAETVKLFNETIQVEAEIDKLRRQRACGQGRADCLASGLPGEAGICVCQPRRRQRKRGLYRLPDPGTRLSCLCTLQRRGVRPPAGPLAELPRRRADRARSRSSQTEENQPCLYGTDGGSRKASSRLQRTGRPCKPGTAGLYGIHSQTDCKDGTLIGKSAVTVRLQYGTFLDVPARCVIP